MATVKKKDAYDFEAMYVVQQVRTQDDLTHVFATLDYDPGVRIAVCADEDTVYGWERPTGVEVRFTLARQPNYLRPGDVVKVQSSDMPTIAPKPVGP